MGDAQTARVPPVAVFTGTVGDPCLTRCIESVARQTYAGEVTHWVVVDGPEHESRVRELLPADHEARLFVLPENTGGRGYDGHRIYAMGPWWVESEYVAFLDEDNAWEPDHLARVVSAIRSVPGARWGYGLRRLVDKDGADAGTDRCESLGGIRPTCLQPEDRMVDVSCYVLETSLARDVSGVWNRKARPANGFHEADRTLCRTLLEKGPYGVSRVPTVVYRIAHGPKAVTARFFELGNARTGYDETRTDAYVFGPSRDQTQRWVRLCSTNPVFDAFNWLDGYACAPYLPHQALCVVLERYDFSWAPWFGQRSDLNRFTFDAFWTADSYASFVRDVLWIPKSLEIPPDQVASLYRPMSTDAPVRVAVCLTGHVRNATSTTETLDLLRTIVDMKDLDVDVYVHTWDRLEGKHSWRNLDASNQAMETDASVIQAYLEPLGSRVRCVCVDPEPPVPESWKTERVGQIKGYPSNWSTTIAHQRLAQRFVCTYPFIVRLRWDAPTIHRHNFTYPITPNVLREVLPQAARVGSDLFCFPRCKKKCVGLGNGAWMSHKTFAGWLDLCRTPDWYVRDEFQAVAFPEWVLYEAWWAAAHRRRNPRWMGWVEPNDPRKIRDEKTAPDGIPTPIHAHARLHAAPT